MKLTTPLAITFAGTFVALAGFAVYLISTGHDPSTYVSALVTIIALIPGTIGIAVSQKKTDDKVTTIQTNTNGTLSKLQAQLDAAKAENAALRSVATPAQIQQVAPIVPVTPAQPAPPIVDPIPVPNVPTPVVSASSGNL
jgi:hypothetical protein